MFVSLIVKKINVIISRTKGGIKDPEADSCTQFDRSMRLSLQWQLSVEDDQLMRISPTKTMKSKNTSSVPAMRIDTRGRRDDCNTM